MDWISVPVEHREQETPRYCGPAAAQMVLGASGRDIETQDRLFHRWCNSQIDVSWTTSPESLAITLARRMPARADRRRVVTSASIDATTRRLCRAVSQGDAPIVLVYNLDHWIVVSGCQVSAWPAAADDIAYAIHGLMIHDPAIRRASGSRNAPLLHVVTYREWARSYLRFPVLPELVAYPPYKGRYIVIGADEPGASSPQQAFDNAYGDARPAEQAMRDASRALVEAPLLQSEPWISLREQLCPGKPVLTGSIVRDDDATWHVPFLRHDDQRTSARWGSTAGGVRGWLEPRGLEQTASDVPLVVRVGALTGEFREAIASQGGTLDLASIAGRDRWENAGYRLPE